MQEGFPLTRNRSCLQMKPTSKTRHMFLKPPVNVPYVILIANLRDPNKESCIPTGYYEQLPFNVDAPHRQDANPTYVVP